MKKHLTKINFTKIIILLFLIVFFLSFNFSFAQDRETKDAEATEEESAALEEIHREDAEWCKQQVDSLSDEEIAEGLNPGGPYVPVQEQGGPLLNNTVIIRDLSIQICTYTRVTKRVQQALEKQELIYKPSLRRQGTTQAEKFKEQLIDRETGVIHNAYQKDGVDEGDGPLYIEDWKKQINEVKKEMVAVSLDELQNSEDLFKEETAKQLAQQEYAEKPSVPASTLTPEELEKLRNRETEDSEQFWDFFEKAANNYIPNTEASSYIGAARKLYKDVDEAEKNAREKAIAGGGYLDNRECISWVTIGPDGETPDPPICNEWVTITPASLVEEANKQVQNIRLEKALNPEPGDISSGSEPTAIELLENDYKESGGGGDGGSTLSFDDIYNLILEWLDTFNELTEQI